MLILKANYMMILYKNIKNMVNNLIYFEYICNSNT